jgi:ribosomal protein S18 acetylase RimI-like enzyme
MIRPIEARDLTRVAEIHRRAFPESMISRLGAEAVCRYYEWQLTGPHDVVARGFLAQGSLVAYCFGGVFRGALSGYLRKNRWFLARRLLLRPGLLTSPEFRGPILRGARISSRHSRARDAVDTKATSFGILAIATDPDWTGRGIGRRLMEEMESEAVGRGFARMHLSVDPQNTTAIRFYANLGWQSVIQNGTCVYLQKSILNESDISNGRR